jgi:hypothetical protein
MENNRIIGDFLEINSDIVQQEFESKLPKFMKKMKSKKLRKRLLDNIDKLRNSNMILGTDNLIELFSYVYNNFYPEASYKSIIKCKVDLDKEEYEAVIQFDNQTSIITIEKDTYPKFNINSKIMISKGASKGINIQVHELFSDNPTKNEILSNVNRELLNIICDYIEEIVEPYLNNKENSNEYIEGSVLGVSIQEE